MSSTQREEINSPLKELKNRVPKSSTSVVQLPENENRKANFGTIGTTTDRFIANRKSSNFHIAFTLAHDQTTIKTGDFISSSNLFKEFVLNNKPALGGNSKLNKNILRFVNDRHNKNSDFLSGNSEFLFEFDSGIQTPKANRRIPKYPYKVLDAPSLQDDFYLNLVDWSSRNLLAVGLSNSVYLWSANSSEVMKVCDFGDSNMATSVCWAQHRPHLAIGNSLGEIQIWDCDKNKQIQTFQGHSSRVGVCSWNGNLIASGSRDKNILIRDVRTSEYSLINSLKGHKQEICGLKWSCDGQFLASGGNDNKVFVWTSHSKVPLTRFNEHCAAVKALSWSPHQHGLLASGGGTADRTIRFWDTKRLALVETVDTGSQVCNLIFSKNSNELVSTHGYSLNQIIVWKFPCKEKLATLTGHTFRVLYLAMNPDGQTIVTGAGDETLRFWNVFPEKNEQKCNLESVLNLNNTFLR